MRNKRILYASPFVPAEWIAAHGLEPFRLFPASPAGAAAACAPGGGYACGSGNSITNYMPTENYLAMIQTIHRFNGRM